MVYNTIAYQEQTLNEILSAIGYPTLTKDDIYAETPLESIESLIMLPALREFHKWFPQVLKEEYSVSSTFDIAFPNINVFNVNDVRLNTSEVAGAPSASPFVNMVNYSQSSTSSTRRYGTNNDYGFREVQIYSEQERRAVIDRYKGLNIDVDTVNRKVTGYSTMTGRLMISWAMWNPTIENVPFNRLQEVIDLCKANLLEHVGTLRGMLDSNTSSSFNYELLLTKAEGLKTEILTKWKAYSKITVLRG